MPTEWPNDDGGPFTLVYIDLAPLREQYPGGELFLPDGLDDLLEAPAFLERVHDRRAVAVHGARDALTARD